ncbi:MAG: hypothetical protein HOA33_09160 [Gammaproteobacteria bacterium]|nr:hypothetical protein [Gammaproteobacteria bacterium]
MKASNYESRSEDDGSTSAIHGRAVFRQFYLREKKLRIDTRLAIRQVLSGTLFTIGVLLSSQLIAAERTLVVDPLTTGPYAVGSSNFTTSGSAVSAVLAEGLDAGQLQQGINHNGELRYISELLAFPDDAFSFQMLVPNDSALYGASAGSLVSYTGYILYPTTQTNTRTGYDVFIPPSLPHMQVEGEQPLFADETKKFPMLVYSHGQGDHPTAAQLDFLIQLASHGYVVVALYHGDNRFGGTEGRQFNLRPLAIKTAIDEILADAAYSSHIDAEKIGGLGQSSGGATMLALLGAKKVNPDFSSVFANTLLETTVDPRIKAAATTVPYLGQGVYAFLGSGGTGAATVDRPFMANSANVDTVADYSKVQQAMANIPGVKYLVEYDGEGHSMSDGAVNDAHTWTKVFLDAFIKQDATAIETLSQLKSVSDSGADSLVLVTEPAVSSTSPVAATFADNQLTVSGVAVGDVSYDVVLSAVSLIDPITFSLASADIAIDATAIAGSFANGILTIPLLVVGSTSYSITLSLTSESPVEFVLAGATEL